MKINFITFIIFISLSQNINGQFRFQLEGSLVTRIARIENYGYIPSFYELNKIPISAPANFSVGYQFKNQFGFSLGMNHISIINKEKFFLDAFDVNYRLFSRTTSVSSFEPQLMFDYSFDIFRIRDIRLEIGVDFPIQKMRSYIWSNSVDYLNQHGEIATMSLVKSTKASGKSTLKPRLNIGKQFNIRGSEKHKIYLALTLRKSFDNHEISYNVNDKGIDYNFKYFINSSFFGLTSRYTFNGLK